MSDANGSVGAGGGGQNVGTSGVTADVSEQPKQTAKPIPDSVWKRGKSASELAVDDIIKDSKREANQAKSRKYEVEEPEDAPADKKVTREPERGKEEVKLAGDRPRDEQGRFVAAETSEAPAQGKDASPAPATPAAPSPKVKFAGQEWDDLSAAEKAYAERDWHLARAIESANAWKAEAERRAAAASQTPAPTEPSKAETPAEADATGLDPEMVQEVYAAANEAGKPWLFTQWVAEENAKQVQALIDRRLAEVTKPQQEAQAREALKSEIVQGWTSLKQYTRADGTPAFPEIGNFEAEQQIGEYWVSLGLPPEAMRNPATMMAAIGLYRIMTEDTSKNGVAPAPSVPAPPVPNADAEAVTTGLPSRINPAAEPESPAARYLSNALNRVGHVGKDADGRAVRLWSR